MAIRGAQEIACRRGVVLDRAVILRSHYDFILFTAGCTVFVRIKRIRTHISNPLEIARMFNEEIQQLRRIPKTAVISREIWVLSPWKTWQYFQILDDRIVEVRCDGQPVLQAERLILEKTDNGNYRDPSMHG
jgi:hypothetical protein